MKGFLVLAIFLGFHPRLFASNEITANPGRCTSNQYERIQRCHELSDESQCNGECFWVPVGFAHCAGQAEEWFACKNYDEKTCAESEEFTPGCRWVVEQFLSLRTKRSNPIAIASTMGLLRPSGSQ